MIVEINAYGPRRNNTTVCPQIKWELLWVAFAPESVARQANFEWEPIDDENAWGLMRVEMRLNGRYGWFPPMPLIGTPP